VLAYPSPRISGGPLMDVTLLFDMRFAALFGMLFTSILLMAAE
jgi:hypothetical protein